MNSSNKKAAGAGVAAGTGWGLGEISAAISVKKTADSLANGDAEIKNGSWSSAPWNISIGEFQQTRIGAGTNTWRTSKFILWSTKTTRLALNG